MSGEHRHGAAKSIHLVIVGAAGEPLRFIKKGGNLGALHQRHIASFCGTAHRIGAYLLRAGGAMASHRKPWQDMPLIMGNQRNTGTVRFLLDGNIDQGAVLLCRLPNQRLYPAWRATSALDVD